MEGAHGVGIRGPNPSPAGGEGVSWAETPRRRRELGKASVVLSRWTKVSGRGQLDMWAVPLKVRKGLMEVTKEFSFHPDGSTMPQLV